MPSRNDMSASTTMKEGAMMLFQMHRGRDLPAGCSSVYDKRVFKASKASISRSAKDLGDYLCDFTYAYVKSDPVKSTR